MRYILLWLEGPMQAWGYDSKFSARQTLDFPTKSGILGLVLCAMGKAGPQEDLLSRLNKLNHTVYSFARDNCNVSEMVDFHVVGNGYKNEGWEGNFIPRKRDKGIANTGGSKLTYRHYLQDASFAVIMEVPDDMADEVASKLKCPVWPLYLGRKTCIPSAPIYRGLFETETEAEEEKDRLTSSRYNPLFKVVDGCFPEKGEVLPLSDIPLCFGPVKKYSSRYVTICKEVADEQ